MVTVELKKLPDAKNEKLYVSFDFDMRLVEKIKSLPVPDRRFKPEMRSWEVPVKNLPQLIDLFSDEEVKLIGPVHTDSKVVEPEKQKVLPKPSLDGFTFKTEPLDHQVEGFNYAMEHPQFILGDEQGLGKTKQFIDAAVARKGQMKHCLVIPCVATLRWNWLEEIPKHSNEKAHLIGSRINRKGKIVDGSIKDRIADLDNDIDAFFIITNIETMRDKKFAAKIEKMCKDGVIGMVGLDEVHKCANPSSQQGKSIHKISCYYKIPMTGTLLLNKPLDLYQPLKFVGEETGSFYGFRNRYCVMGGFGGHEIVGYKNLDELQRRVAKVQLRRRKCDVLNLPPKIRTTEIIEMTAKQAILYKEIINNIRENLDEISLSPNPLAQLIRLRQVTGAPEIISSTITESAKLDRLEDLVEELVSSGRKVIVFSNWEQVVGAAARRLEQYNPLIITGAVKAEDRQSIVNKFQTDEKSSVIMGTIGAMGTGITLTAADTVIFLDKPWNLANTEQAEDRAHRIGTKWTVNIITLVCKDTIDERIEEIIAEKGDLSEALVDGKMEKLARRKLLERLVA